MGRLGLAEQLLAGDKGLFIGIFPEIAEDEAAFLIPDLRDHLAQRSSFLEAGKHLADHLLPFPFGQHDVRLAAVFRGDVAHQLGFHHPLHCPSPLFCCDSDTAWRETKS